MSFNVGEIVSLLQCLSHGGETLVTIVQSLPNQHDQFHSVVFGVRFALVAKHDEAKPHAAAGDCDSGTVRVCARARTRVCVCVSVCVRESVRARL